MYQKLTLLGRVGNTEYRMTNSGGLVGTVSLATSESRKDANGERKEETSWHKVIAFNKTAEILQKYVQKGDRLFVEGKIQYRKWQDKEGNDKYSTEIIANEIKLLGDKKSNDTPQNKGYDSGNNFDDDIPF